MTCPHRFRGAHWRAQWDGQEPDGTQWLRCLDCGAQLQVRIIKDSRLSA